MAFCSECGQKIEQGAKFCSGCGKPIGDNNGSQRKQVFEGNIHKCPNCGEVIKSFVTICPSCGFEFRDTKSSNAVKEFADKLEYLQSQKKAPSIISGVAKSLGIGKSDNNEEKILNMIRNFTVPNTKEDVFEFMILASSNINISAISAEYSSDAGANSTEELNAMKARSDAWQSKMEQVYQKANIAFGSDPDFIKIRDLYDRTTKAINSAKKAKSRKTRNTIILGLCLMFVPAILFGLVGYIPHRMRENKLEQTVQEIQVDISNGDYDAALIKAQSLHMDDNWSSESKEHWDEQRESLIKLIEQKKEDNK
ncbi:zinc ribbon domain-containing protein [Butyrivibrio fibrisolvens]|uniref:zinc ribbon domain-containing protein n=1 Tax=Butyrivibrio fibrisolvens TaxID=831 RepID=UPI0003F686EC|nr:zinc ribbon domain-containing protein [Butyrivibrio fibrisolvens]